LQRGALLAPARLKIVYLVVNKALHCSFRDTELVTTFLLDDFITTRRNPVENLYVVESGRSVVQIPVPEDWSKEVFRARVGMDFRVFLRMVPGKGMRDQSAKQG
jgi:hypothetical protein